MTGHSGINGRRRAALCALLAAALASWALPAVGDDLGAAVDAVLADKRLMGATLGVEVRSLATGQVLCARNGTVRMIPASNEKLLTSAAALTDLGAGYEFRTALMAGAGAVLTDGVLGGDLILRGGADPTLGSVEAGEQPLAQFQAWADEVRALGMLRVKGDLVVDDTFLDRQEVHPDWPPGQEWRDYCAPVSAMPLNDNCVMVQVRPGARQGAVATVSLSPAVPFLQVANQCLTDAKRHAVWFSRRSGSQIIRVGGFVRLGTGGYTGAVSAPYPALFSGAALAEVLKSRGVELAGTVRLAGPGDLARRREWGILCERRTPLTRVLSIMLKESQNMYAEHVLKAVGAESTPGRPGSWESGCARVSAMLQGLGWTPSDYSLADGSGLSRNNRVSASIICSVLMAMDRLPAGRELPDMLATAGADGTLGRRLKAEPYAGNVQAKTGYVRGAGALSGYARTRAGTRVAFSILINNFTPPTDNSAMKDIEDAVLRAIVDRAR